MFLSQDIHMEHTSNLSVSECSLCELIRLLWSNKFYMQAYSTFLSNIVRVNTVTCLGVMCYHLSFRVQPKQSTKLVEATQEDILYEDETGSDAGEQSEML